MVYCRRYFNALPLIVLILVNSGWDDPQNASREDVEEFCKHAQEHRSLCDKLEAVEPTFNLVDFSKTLCERSGIEESWIEIRNLKEEIESGCRYIDTIVQIKSIIPVNITHIITLLFNMEYFSNTEKVRFLRLEEPSIIYSKWSFELHYVTRHLLGSPRFDQDQLMRFYVSLPVYKSGVSVVQILALASEYCFDRDVTGPENRKNPQILKELNQLYTKDQLQSFSTILKTKNKEFSKILARHDRTRLKHSVLASLHLLFQVFDDHTKKYRMEKLSDILINIRAETPLICLAFDPGSQNEKVSFMNLIKNCPGFTAQEAKAINAIGTKIPLSHEVAIHLNLDRVKTASKVIRGRSDDSYHQDINDYRVIWKALSSRPIKDEN